MRRAAHAGVEGGEQAGRAGADDGDIFGLLHRANASVLIVVGLLACASGGPRAALGWSLGGEAHVFVNDDDFARHYYHQLTGEGQLADALAGHEIVAVDARNARSATVLSANGAAAARLTLARFHAPRTCGYSGIVTELVFAFPPGGAAGRSAPPSHVSVVALLDQPPFAGGAGKAPPPLSTAHSTAPHPPGADPAEALPTGAATCQLPTP